MVPSAHFGATFPSNFGVCALALLVCACTSATEVKQSGIDASSTASECEETSDCVLIAKGCCGACEPTLDDVSAVPTVDREAAEKLACPSPVACGPCAPEMHDPLAPRVVAACEAGRCVARDVREDESSKCTRDEECTLQSRGCCEGCGPSPSGFIALRKGEPAPVVCDPTPPCAPCGESLAPEAYCALDGHCAVREVARASGRESSTCFSPSQNLDDAYERGAVGCDCYSAGASVCIADSRGRKVALVCSDSRWGAVEDGPCEPAPSP